MSFTPLANKNATATINSVAYAIMDGTLEDAFDEVDLTNLQSGGFQSIWPSVRRINLTGLKIAYDSTNPFSVATGSSQPIAFSIPGGSSYVGTFVILKKSKPFLDPTGYFVVTADLKNQGVVTITE